MSHSVNSDEIFSNPTKRESLTSAMESAGIGTWDIDLTSVPGLTADELCKTIPGVKDNELTYELASESINSEDPEKIGEALRQAQLASSGGKFDISYTVTVKGIHDGAIKMIRSVGSVRFDENDKATGASGITMHTEEPHQLKKEILKLKSLVDTSPDFLGISNSENGIEFINQTGVETYGITPGDDYSELNVGDFYDLEKTTSLDEIRESIDTTGSWTGQVFLKHHKSGESIPAAGTYRQIIDPTTGKVIGRSANLRDLRPEYAARKALKESEEFSRKVLAQSPVGIAVLKGRDLIVTSANEGMLHIWDKTSEIEGKQLTDILPDLEATEYVGILQHVYTTGNPFYGYAVKVLNPKLADSFFDIVYKPLLNENNAVEGIILLASDVTQQRKANQSLAESESRFRGLIESAPFATAVYRGENMIIELANEPMFRMWGKNESVVNKPLLEGIPELAGQQFLGHLRKVYTEGKPYSAMEEPGDLIVDGKLSKFYFNYTYQPLFDADGKVYAIMNMAVDVTEQVLNRKAIEKSQEELLAYFEQSPVAIATISKENLVFELANPFYAELVGRTVDQLVNKPLIKAIPEIAGQGFIELINEVITTGIPYIADGVPVDLVRDGQLTTQYVNLHYHPKRNARNEIVGILVVATDVTALAKANNELKVSETKLRGIISSAPAGIGLFVGRDLIIENPNKTFIDIVGKGPGIEGLPLREAMPELLSEGQPFLQILDDVFTTGNMFQSFGSLVKIVQNGVMTNNYYNITYSPVFNEEGEVYAILDIAIDVTEQVVARMKLQEAETRLLGAIEVAGLATWVFNIKDNSFSYSDRFMEWLGFTNDTKSLDEAYNPLPGEFRDIVPAALESAIASNGKYDLIHPVVNSKTGEKRIIHAQGQVFYDENGEPELMHGTAQDITIEQEIQLELTRQVQERTEELAAANEELIASNESLETIIDELSASNNELSQYAYVASHDLQEPLRKIRMFSSMLKAKNAIPDDQRMIIEKIDKSSERMSLLIADLLEFSRTNKDKKANSPVDLNEIVKAVLGDFELLIEEKQAEIVVEKLPVIDGISLQMNQLFYNLMSNALKFSLPGRPLKISLGSSPVSVHEIEARFPALKIIPDTDYYDIVISDNGIGFSDEYAEQIFEVFKRLHEKSIYPGSGIGLALCRKIVNHHNGTIYADSVKGEGTSFHIILPVIS